MHAKVAHTQHIPQMLDWIEIWGIWTPSQHLRLVVLLEPFLRMKDSTKLLLLYNENILNNDPHRESKDVVFSQSYLNRMCNALQDIPEQMEEFASLLNESEQVGEREEPLLLSRKVCGILANQMDIL
uniref:Uncharacterized protein n=1 Tax=Amphiprion ocellaris TaxID=80972 RepID=A0AAQ5X068_AMPOC